LIDTPGESHPRTEFVLFGVDQGLRRIRFVRRERPVEREQVRRGGGLQNGFSGGTTFVDPADSGNQGTDPDRESPTSVSTT
jgi:hypothetical protein